LVLHNEFSTDITIHNVTTIPLAIEMLGAMFHLFRGWPLVLTLIAIGSLLVFAWIVIGIFTPLWDVPDLPRGPSYVNLLRTRPGRQKRDRQLRNAKRQATVLALPRVLLWNQAVLNLAELERAVWRDYENGVYVRDFDYGDLLVGAEGVVRQFLSRCQDADQALRRAAGLAAQPGYGELLSPQQEQVISDALGAVDAALAFVEEATRVVGDGKTSRAERFPGEGQIVREFSDFTAIKCGEPGKLVVQCFVRRAA